MGRGGQKSRKTLRTSFVNGPKPASLNGWKNFKTAKVIGSGCGRAPLLPLVESHSSSRLKFFHPFKITGTYVTWRSSISGKSIAPSHILQSSNLKTWRGTTKKHSMKSIDRANMNWINSVLFCCISFRSQVMKVRKNWREQYFCHWWYPWFTGISQRTSALFTPSCQRKQTVSLPPYIVRIWIRADLLTWALVKYYWSGTTWMWQIFQQQYQVWACKCGSGHDQQQAWKRHRYEYFLTCHRISEGKKKIKCEKRKRTAGGQGYEGVCA